MMNTVYIVTTHVYNTCEGADIINAVCATYDKALEMKANARSQWKARTATYPDECGWSSFHTEITEMEVIS